MTTLQTDITNVFNSTAAPTTTFAPSSATTTAAPTNATTTPAPATNGVTIDITKMSLNDVISQYYMFNGSNQPSGGCGGYIPANSTATTLSPVSVNDIQNIIQSISSTIQSNSTSTPGPSPSSFGSNLNSGVKAIGGDIQSGIQAVGGDVQGGVQAVGSGLQSVAQTVGGDLQSVAQTVGGDVQGVVRAVGQDINSLGNGGYNGGYNNGYNGYGGYGIQTQRDNYYVPYPVAQGVNPYSYNGALPTKGSTNFMPVTADFSKFGR